MPLTDTAIKKLQPGDKPVKVTDERGLYLLLNPTGSKLWRWKYRFDGKEKVMPLGQYPDVSLAQAREARENARKQLASGTDPMAQRKATKIARRLAVEDTFAAIAKKWWEGWKAARSESHTLYVWRRLEADVFPIIGSRPISEIQVPELVVMMKKIEERGALDIAKRALQTCGQIFRYAIAHGVANQNPAASIRPSDVLASRKKENYARVDAKELPNLLRKIEVYQGAAITRVNLSDPAMEEALYDMALFREFVGLDAGEDNLPDESTILRFRHLLESHDLSLQILATVNATLAAKGLPREVPQIMRRLMKLTNAHKAPRMMSFPLLKLVS